VIQGSDVYHLTPAPSHQDPQGWMALQYVTQTGARSVLMAYRLRDSKPEQHWKLRGLDPAASYRITIDGKHCPIPSASRNWRSPACRCVSMLNGAPPWWNFRQCHGEV